MTALSRRELEVLRTVATADSQEAAAQRLGISHLTTIRHKLGVKTTLQAAWVVWVGR